MIQTTGTHCWPTPRVHCWPYDWPYSYDRELERLRELERRAAVEEEKQRIRERLWRRGINPDAPCFPMLPVPCLPSLQPPIFYALGARKPSTSIGDVLQRIG